MPRAWLLPDSTGYQSLELKQVPLEEPGPGDVRIKVEAFALNWGDMNLMLDRYSFHLPGFPAKVGIEAAGIVDAVGEGVTRFKPGDRVASMPYFYYARGASTESLIIQERFVTLTPPNLSKTEAASVWMQYLTAYFPLAEVSKVGPGDCVLVTAATSTAGSAALQIGRLLGATMIGTTRYGYNGAFMREMGADHVLVTGEGDTDLGAELKRITSGKGLKLAFDPVGASLIGQYAPALGRDARIYYYGSLDQGKFELPFFDMYQKNAVFQPYSVFNYVDDPALCPRGQKFVYDALADGRLKPNVDRVYPMEEFIAAWDYLKEPRQSHGKVIIETGL